MKKILSIIVPSYNMEAYLPKCLSSLIIDDKELLQKLDVIIVNDGSKDRTSEIAHEFEARNHGVYRVIDKENGHYGSCINVGLATAKGVYVKVLDADDWFNTVNFCGYMHLLDSEVDKGLNGADLIVNDFEFVDAANCSVKSYNWINDASTVADFDYQNGHDLWMHAVAYRVDKVCGIGYRQLTGITHTDIQWLQMPMRTVKRIAYFPKTVYEYLYLREGNTSTPDEFYRTYAVQEKILRHMIEEYEALTVPVDETVNTYLRNHLIYRARRAYYVHLMDRNPLLKDDSLVELDSFLKDKARWIYDATDNGQFSLKISWRYVHAWRKKQRYSFWQKMERLLFECALLIWGKLRRVI